MSSAVSSQPPSMPSSAGQTVTMATSPRRQSRSRTPGSCGERLTPMPEYMRPVTKSAMRRWKKLHEDHMMDKLMERRKEKKQQNRATREEAIRIARKIPVELLAKDWMKQNAVTVETRAYLVDKILPTLILGVEKLLMEVDKRELAEQKDTEPNFNPINFLAQYLMRNNPKYSNFSEASPYIRGLREIVEELKQDLFDIDENKLAKAKAEARQKREERERQEMLWQMEKERRAVAVIKQFKEWHAGDRPDAKVELALVQNALRSFEEKVQKLPVEVRHSARYSNEVEPTDDTGKMMPVREFAAYVHLFIEDMSSEMFDQFMLHLSQCALAIRAKEEREQRKVVLSELFVACDHTGVGLLDRHRILNLFEMFYDKSQESVKSILRNPRKWPVVDMNQMNATMEDSDDEEQDLRYYDDQKDVTEETKAAEMETEEEQEAVPEKGVDDNGTDKAKDEIDNTKETENSGSKADSADDNKADKNEVEKQDTEPENKDKESEDLMDSDTKPDTQDEGQDKEELIAAEDQAKSAGEPPRTQQSKVSFAEGTAFEREMTLVTAHGTRSHSQASAYDESSLNVSQFVQLTETFLGDLPEMECFNFIVRYIRTGYVETEEERMERLIKAREEAQSAKRKALLNSLFEMWDNDGSGFLDLDEVLIVMKKYKEGIENEAIDRAYDAELLRLEEAHVELYALEEAKKNIKRRTKYLDNRLSKREFREFVYKCVQSMAGGENFDPFVEFLINSVERTYTERVRGEARKKWMQQIITAGETSGAKIEPVYKAVFQSLFKDAESHGGGKIISANISLLERNEVAPQRGDALLRYVATTPDDAPYMLNRLLFKDMPGISFASIESGKPLHVPRVNNHGNIHFWHPDRPDEEHDGSFIVVPLKDQKKRVFGLLGIDTLNDPNGRAIFITHEIQFFQGIAKAFSISYHYVDMLQKTIRISESAVSWIQRRSPHVHQATVYMVEPEHKTQDFALRKMMATDERAMVVAEKVPPRLARKDNLFRDYLFKCVDNSESVTADAYGERHLAIPLRDEEGRAIVVIDISIGELKELPKAESREIMKMLKLLQMAYREISRDSREDAEGEKMTDDSKSGILFDRLMLIELKENVSKLDAKAYGEIKSYKEPPKVVHQSLKAVLAVFNPSQTRNGEFNNWDHCKKYVGPQLNQKILAYDPTADLTDDVSVELINSYLEEVPHGSVSKHGSIPAQFLYNWVFVCVSMLEHSRKMRKAAPQELTEEPPKKNISRDLTPNPDQETVKQKSTVKGEGNEAEHQQIEIGSVSTSAN